jgi:hypothetical protein
MINILRKVLKKYSVCGVRVPAGAGNFSLHHCIQTGSGAHPGSYLRSTRGSFPGEKVTGA